MTRVVRKARGNANRDACCDRGTYRRDGMTIELKADDGTVARILGLPIDNTYDSIYIYGQSYSRK